MGYGYFTFEELQWAEDGRLITDSTRDYKIPCVMDVPEKFNVTFLRNSRNLKAVYSSKVRKLILMLFCKTDVDVNYDCLIPHPSECLAWAHDLILPAIIFRLKGAMK